MLCIGLDCSVLRLRQHSIGYMGNGFYRSKDPTNSIKVLKEMLQRRKETTKTTKYTYPQTIIYAQKDIHKISTTSSPVYTNMGGLGRGQLPQRAGSLLARPERRWGCFQALYNIGSHLSFIYLFIYFRFQCFYSY